MLQVESLRKPEHSVVVSLQIKNMTSLISGKKYQHKVVQLKLFHTKPPLKVLSLLYISDFDGPRSHPNYVHIMSPTHIHARALKCATLDDPTSSYLQLPNYKDEQSTVHSQLGIKR